MSDDSSHVEAQVLAAVASELGALNRSVPEDDRMARLEQARALVAWVGRRLTVDRQTLESLGRDVSELSSGRRREVDQGLFVKKIEQMLDLQDTDQGRLDETIDAGTRSAEPEPTTNEITAYLRSRDPASSDRAHQVQMIRGGFSKRTVLVSCTVQGVETEIVLRQVPVGRQARSLGPEFEVVQAVYAAGLPVPEPLWLEPEPNALGGAFFATRRAAGTNFGDVWGAQGVSTEVCVDIARTYAKIHQIQADGLNTPVSSRSNPQELQEMISWQENTMRKRGLGVGPVLAALFGWLRDNLPDAPAKASLIHGDAAFSNLLIADGHVNAVLDWEMAHLGDPAEELAYLRPSIEPILSWRDFLDHYVQAGGRRPDSAALHFFEVWSYVWRHIGCLWLSQNFETTGRYASAVAAYVHGPRFLREAVRAAFGTQG